MKTTHWQKLKANPELLAEHNRKKRERHRRQWAEAAKDPGEIMALRKKNREAGERWLKKLKKEDPEKYEATVERRKEKDRRIKASLRKQPGFYDKLNAWFRKRRAESSTFRLAQAVRNTMNCALRGRYKAGTYIERIGCTTQQLKEHLEKQFNEGMSWETFGHGAGKWSMDHIRPCASFDLADLEQQKQCFHYTNLRPMWFVDNCSKNSIHEGRKHYHDDHPSMWESPCIQNKPA